MRYVITWLALSVAIALFFGIGTLDLYHLSTRGIWEQGIVIEYLPHLHDQIRYEYHVAGQTFQGKDSWCSNSMAPVIGQLIEVCFDPQHPENSAASDPKGTLENNLIAATLLALFVPSFIVARWIWLVRHRHKRSGVDCGQLQT